MYLYRENLESLDKKLRILFLPKWYPNRFDPMPGLFIQRQAESLADRCEVAVLSVHPVANAPNPYEIDVCYENGVFNVRVYYGVPRTRAFARGIRSAWRFWRANFRGLRMLKSFHPDLVHAQVLTRIGVIALAYKIRRRVPYVISEHWSRYFPENNTYQGSLRKWITRQVVRRSSGVVAVSGKLKSAMEAYGLVHRHFRVIPNVVDPDMFLMSSNPTQPLTRRIVHLSCFEEKSKNITGLLRAVKKVLETRNDFQVYLVGEGPDLESSKRYAASLGLKDVVIFTGIKTDKELVSFLNTADFTVLSSRYETFATVVVESLACGVPVVSTEVGIVPEVIHPGNGLIVPPGDDDRMAGAILKMLKDCRQYDRDRIREEIIGKYSAEAIADQLMNVYHTALGNESPPGN